MGFEKRVELEGNGWRFLVSHSKDELTVNGDNELVLSGRTFSDEDIKMEYFSRGYPEVFVTNSDSEFPSMRNVFVRGERYSLN
jgi:hypothetical protein